MASHGVCERHKKYTFPGNSFDSWKPLFIHANVSGQELNVIILLWINTFPEDQREREADGKCLMLQTGKLIPDKVPFLLVCSVTRQPQKIRMISDPLLGTKILKIRINEKLRFTECSPSGIK